VICSKEIFFCCKAASHRKQLRCSVVLGIVVVEAGMIPVFSSLSLSSALDRTLQSAKFFGKIQSAQDPLLCFFLACMTSCVVLFMGAFPPMRIGWTFGFMGVNLSKMSLDAPILSCRDLLLARFE